MTRKRLRVQFRCNYNWPNCKAHEKQHNFKNIYIFELQLVESTDMDPADTEARLYIYMYIEKEDRKKTHQSITVVNINKDTGNLGP